MVFSSLVCGICTIWSYSSQCWDVRRLQEVWWFWQKIVKFVVWVILLNEFSKIYPSWFLNLTKWLEIPGMPLVWFGLASSSSIVWRCWLRWFLKSLPTLSIAWNLKILIKLMQHISFKDLLWKRETKKRDPKKVFDLDGIGLFLWHYYSISDNPTLTYSNVQ